MSFASRLRLPFAVAVTLASAGCTDYLARRETIDAHAGEAMAYNRAIHIIDPWPAHAARTAIAVDGVRVERVMERYRSGEPAPAAPAANASITMRN